MKIRCKNGDEIDLAKLRQRCEENVADRSHPLGTIATREDLALLDALEAALSVSPRDCEAQTIEMSDYKEGWNECRDEQRRRIGVIEESA